MDYRPIALLQSCYKVVAKVLSHRVHKAVEVPIQDTQQGFVHGRQMSKTVIIMAHQLSAAHEPDREPTDSRAIRLLDFCRAYDTVSRDFLFEVMRYFGFADSFITMIQNLHHIPPLGLPPQTAPHRLLPEKPGSVPRSIAPRSSC